MRGRHPARSLESSREGGHGPDRCVDFRLGPGGHGSPEGGRKAPARGTPRLDVGLELGHHAEVAARAFQW